MNLGLFLVKLAASPGSFTPAGLESGSTGVEDVFQTQPGRRDDSGFEQLQQSPPYFQGRAAVTGETTTVNLRPDQYTHFGGKTLTVPNRQMQSDSQLAKLYGANYAPYRQEVGKAFGSDPKTLNQAMNVMWMESGKGQNAAAGDAGGQSRGLFQINQPAHPDFKGAPTDWRANVDYAGKLYQQSGWKPWATSRARLTGFEAGGGR